MYSFADIHESRKLKQARQKCQYVDLLRFFCACYSLMSEEILTYSPKKVKKNMWDPEKSGSHRII